jgi:aryl-alcohol dehydrogenase-like predicted oxidoreductase
MQVVRMGRTGLRVTRVCLGTMTFGNQCDAAESFRIMDAAMEGGVRFFDTADVYPLGGDAGTRGATEEIVGRWMRDRGAREDIVLATKCRGAMGPGANDEGLGRKHILAACDASLRRLQTDYIDLYQVHGPDPETPIEETMRALDDLVRAGKVRHAGCSNFPAWQLAGALWASDVRGLARFDCAQPRYNLLFRMIEDEILPLCRAHGLGVIAYNPLAGGMLTGRYRGAAAPEPGTRFTLRGSGEMYRRRYWNEAVMAAVDRLGRFVEARGKHLTHVALAWVLAQPGITAAIVGASRAEQLRDSLGGAELALDAEEREACDEVWFGLPRERDAGIARR